MTTPADNDVGTDPLTGPTTEPEPELPAQPKPAGPVRQRLRVVWARRWVRVVAGVGSVGTILGTVLTVVQLNDRINPPGVQPLVEGSRKAQPCHPIEISDKPPEGSTWVLAVNSTSPRDRQIDFYRVPSGTRRPILVSLDSTKPDTAYTMYNIELFALPTEVVDHIQNAMGITSDRPWKATVMPLHDEAPHSIKVQRDVGQDTC